MKHNTERNKRIAIILFILIILLIVLALWMFTRASEDVEPEQQKPYESYRHNIFGVAGDFCVFTEEDASLSECTADIAIGGALKRGSFGNYNTQWEQFYKNHLECVNLNSYIRGKYESDGGYNWQGKPKSELQCTDGSYKGTYDCDNQKGKANLYIYTGENSDNVVSTEGVNPNQCKINDKCHDNTQCNDGGQGKTYNAYNVIEVKNEIIDFGKEFEYLRNLSSELKEKGDNAGEDCKINCKNEPNNSHTIKYQMVEDEDTIIITVNPENFFNSSVCDTFDIEGLDVNKKIIINVDCSEAFKNECPKTPKISINGSSSDWNALAENIVWNFYCPEGTPNAQLEADQMIGTILAPNIDVHINGNLDGAVIAKKVEASNAIYGINSGLGWGDIEEVEPQEEKTSVYVEKVWVDNENADNKRPEQVEFKLLADGVDIGKFNLEKEGKTLKLEDALKDTTADNTTSEQQTESTNKSESEKTENQGQESVGETEGDQDKELKDWSCEITDLPKYRKSEDGESEQEEIEYTIKEVEVSDDYTSKVEKIEDNEEGNENNDKYAARYRITNTLVTDIEGKKVWDDNNDSEGLRPESIEVTLYRKDENGAEKKVEKEVTENESEEESEDKNEDQFKNPITVTKNGNNDNEWSYKFEGVPKYDKDNKEIEYFVKEETDGKEWAKKYTTEIEEFTITNKHEEEKTEVKVKKVWDDNNNQDGFRPSSVKVTLKADVGGVDIKDATVTLNKDNNWEHTFTDLPKYKDGEEIGYKVTEEKIDKYETTISDDNVITNKHIPEEISIKGNKTWEDNDDQDGIRPDEMKVKLYANGKELKDKAQTVTKENNWKYEFSNLPKYENGERIKYTVDEEAIDGYEKTVEGYNIINKHKPEQISIEGEKTWIDNDDQDGKRPTDITVKVFADGKELEGKRQKASVENNWHYKFDRLDKYANGKEIKYTIQEEKIKGYTSEVDENYNITNRHEPEKINIKITKTWDDGNNQDGKRPTEIKIKLLADGKQVQESTVKANDDGKWEYEFKDVPKYSKGKEIKYTITEDSIPEYTTQIDGFKITNKHTPAKTSVSGEKIWDDNNDQDGKRPDSITVYLLADGQRVDGKSVTVTEKDNWKYEFKNLPKYKEGKQITYTVEEKKVEGYDDPVIEGFKITNKHTPETTEVEGTKTWADNDNQDGIRPEKITVTLYANGVEKQSKEVKESDGWSYKFENLPKYEAGKKITYTVKEAKVDKYVTTIDGYNITNTHTPEKIEIKGTKTWDDANDQDGKRPGKITVKVLKGDEEVASKDVTASDNWKYKFEGLDKYENGKEIEYTIKEETVTGYETEIDGYNITNIHKPETTEVEGKKTWNDENDQDGIRPDSITVKLLANGKEVDGKKQKVTSEDGWKYKFEKLPKYSKGELIEYTVEEEKVTGYEAKVDDKNNITNTHKPETIKVSGEKTWEDEDNQDGIRPESITITLLADGKEVKDSTKKVTKADNWKYEFTDLPKYNNGKEITYTVKEVKVDGYTTKVNGMNITNTHTPDTVKVSGTKKWVDEDNQDGMRPNSIVVRLLADGTEVDHKTVTATDGWKYEFTGLAKCKNGKEITYTVKEDDVEGYESKVDGKNNITNTHKIEKTTIEGTKTWNDFNNQENVRPESITIRLYANGKEVKSKKVTEKDGWKYKFDDLDVYENGEKIRYTIREDQLEEYETEVDGYDVNNEHGIVAGGEVIDVTVTKVWDDAGYESKRPSKVTVHLLANGTIVKTQDVTAKTNWEYTFRQLDKYDENDNEIKYTVVEEAISGYETRVDGLKITNTYVPEVADNTIMIKINKYEKGTSKKLSGAKFELAIKKVESKDKYKEVLKKTEKTNSIGQIVLKDLKLDTGKYVLELKETDAPKGYKKSGDAIKIEFSIKEKDGKKVIELKEKYKNVEVEKSTMTVKVENTKEQKKDNTTSKGKLPQTGPGSVVVAGLVIVGFLAIGAIGIFKYREVKF